MWWIALVNGMASYIDAAAIVSSATALVIYQEALGLTPGQIGTLSAMLTLCIALGSFTGGRLGDRFGRKRVFIVTMVVVVIGSAALVLAPTFEALAFGIILVGIGTGADLPVSLATIAEAAGNENRGRLISFSQILWTAGILASNGFGVIVGDLGRLGGQIMFGHVGVVALIVFVFRLGIPESEQWKQAHQSAETQQDHTSQAKARLRVLFSKPYLVPFLALLIFNVLTSFAGNSNGQFGAYMFVNVGGASVSAYSALSIGTGLLGAALILVFMKVVDGKHRMNWFAAGAIGGTVGFAVPAIFGVGLTTLVFQLLMMQLMAAFAFEPIQKVWAQESFPTLLRTTAQGIIVGISKLCVAALGFVTPLILETGPRALFIFLTAAVLIGTVIPYVVFRKHSRNEFRTEDVEADPVT
ncbi:hypothetical protein BH708_02765 [Brachybacterium sp. P6-10-X1]|nr:hypothetical protein BH708_02765 [Brachybacterium sp. P6-10-X1]